MQILQVSFECFRVSLGISANVWLLGDVADNVNELMKTKFNIISVFSAEKLNGNIAKQLL